MTKFLKNADVAGYISQTSVTSSLLKTDSAGKLVAATAGTDYQAPTTALLPAGGTAGQILSKINATDYNTQWIDNFAAQLKHEVKLGATLAKGAAVYVSSSSGTNMIVSAASNASEATSSKTLGLLETGGVTNDLVKVITEGLLAGLDTSTATAGDPVWLGVNGALIFGLANKPVAPAHLVFIGIVTRVQSVNGEIFVKVQNGFELNEIHDILITSIANNQGLFYESSSGLWKNKTIANVLGYTPEPAITAGTTAQYYRGDKTFQTLNTTAVAEGTNLYYTEARVSANTNVAANTAARHNAVTLGTANGLSLSTQVLSLGLASSSANGALSSTDWSTFNGKQNALTNPVTGTGTTNRIPKFTGASTLGNSIITEGTGFITVSGAAVDNAVATFINTDTSSHGIYVKADGFGFKCEPTSMVGGITLNSDGSASFSGDIIANKYIKVGGTSSQFLMADGSVSSGPSGGITGSLTTNYIPKATGANTIGNSQIFDNGTNVGIGTATPAAGAKLTVMGNQTFGIPGNGANTNSRFISIEGNTDVDGEGSGRIFFAENNTSTIDSYGMSLGYRGGSTSIVGASGNTWTGLSLISNGEWGMWGHNDSATGALIMYGDRAATFVNLANNNLNNVNNAYFNGNVGIGTATPTSGFLLKVNGPILNYVTPGGNDRNSIISTDGCQLDFVSYGAGAFPYSNTIGIFKPIDAIGKDLLLMSGEANIRFVTAGYTERVRFWNNGNVSINNTSDAGYKLDVVGTGRFTGTVISDGILRSNQGILQVWGAGVFRGGVYNYVAASGAGTDYSATLVSETNLYFTTGGSATQKMTILSGGNVGINNSSPASKFVVSGSHTSGRGLIEMSSSDDCLIALKKGSATSGLRFQNLSGTDNWFFGDLTAGDIVLQENFSTTRFTMFKGGNFVIGNGSDAGYKLDVNGSVRFTGGLIMDGGLTVNARIQNFVAIGTNENVRTGLVTYDTTAMAEGVGGQLVLGYKYTSAGDYTEGAIIKMYKLNSTNADFSSGIKFQVRNTGADLSTKMTLDPSGRLGIGITPQYPLHVKAGSVVGSRFIVTGTFAPIQFSGDDSVTLGAVNAYADHIVIGRGTSTGVNADISIQQSTGKISMGYGVPLYLASKLITMNGSFRSIITSGASSDRCEIVDTNGSQIDLVSYVAGGQPYSNTIGMFVNGGKDMLLMAGNSNIRFVTAGYTERMRIWNGGNIAIGNTTTDNGYRLQVGGQVNISGSHVGGFGMLNMVSSDAMLVSLDSTTSWDVRVRFKYQGADQWFWGTVSDNVMRLQTGASANAFTVTQAGAGTFLSSVTATSFFESSDKTIKTLIQDNYQTKGIESVVAKLYTKNGKEELGYYAQDVQGILPSAVSIGTDGLLSLSYREVHTAKIARLEKRVAELEQQLKLN
jgi:hypothetical protein